MSDPDRSRPNEAVEKIIGNMTAEMQTCDGQYSPLAFTTPPAEPLNWPQHSNTYINNFHPYAQDMTLGYVPPMDQFNAIPNFNYMQPQPQHIFNLGDYKKEIDPLGPMMYDSLQDRAPNPNLYQNDFALPNADIRHLQNPDQYLMPDMNESEAAYPSQHTHLLENLVGNWAPNTTGTYSPFGNVGPFKPSVVGFDKPQDKEEPSSMVGPNSDDSGYLQCVDKSLEDKKFQFNANASKKPRMVAEVKPMRPSYSDVLTKPVPQTITKLIKTDTKETKHKKDKDSSKKSNKSQKLTGALNRSNTNMDIKEVPIDKTTQFVKISDNKPNSKTGKTQLNRKWVSLDNINEPSDSAKAADETKKKKNDDLVQNKSLQKAAASRKSNKTNNCDNNTDNDSSGTNSKSETVSVSKNLKKTSKSNSNNRPRNAEAFGTNDRPPGKRNQRTRKRENHVLCGVIGQKIMQYLKGWWKMTIVFLLWFVNLISDICSLSLHISHDMAVHLWFWLCVHWSLFLDASLTILNRIKMFTWVFSKFRKDDNAEQQDMSRSFLQQDLQNNINMPTTGEEAMKRLLACKGKDPYSILGVTPTCTDDDIKRYYKRQAFLVHPDKNPQPGAEEAFKILVHAFNMIGEPERRASHDQGVAQSAGYKQAMSEFTTLLQKLQQKMDDAANSIRCSACGDRHRRVKTDRPTYAARNCSTCKIHHAAREGDIWAESRCLGLVWHYFACMEGGVYDITEWAGCQKDSLKHLKSDSHQVQYRIALGNNRNNQARRHSGSPRNDKAADLENLLNSLYGQQQQQENAPGSRRRPKKANK